MLTLIAAPHLKTFAITPTTCSWKAKFEKTRGVLNRALDDLKQHHIQHMQSMQTGLRNEHEFVKDMAKDTATTLWTIYKPPADTPETIDVEYDTIVNDEYFEKKN